MADPGFPVRGGRRPVRGLGPPTWVFLAKNERIGSGRGHAPGTPHRFANGVGHFKPWNQVSNFHSWSNRHGILHRLFELEM